MDPDRNNRTTAIGLAHYAKEYLEAAIAVNQAMGTKKKHATVSPVPAYFLLSHGIELTFKAYLRHSGLTVEELGKIGHDLPALYARSRKLGLDNLYQLTADDTNAFELLVAVNVFHQLRYIETGFKTFPLWIDVEPLAVQLHQAVAPKVGFESLKISYPAAATQLAVSLNLGKLPTASLVYSQRPKKKVALKRVRPSIKAP